MRKFLLRIMPHQDKQLSTSLQKLIFAAVILLTSLFAAGAPTPPPAPPAAPTQNEGIERAEKLCQSMGFPNEVLKCVRAVKGARYFEPAAVDVCADRAFSSEKQVCLESIRDQQYTATGIETCKSLAFSSKIVDCLKEAGKPALIADENKDAKTLESEMRVREEIRRAVRQLEAGNSRRARLILKDLLGETSGGERDVN